MDFAGYNSADQTNTIRDLVTEIEYLRLKRRNEAKHNPHTKGYRFTQEELCYTIYPSYKNLILGRTQNIPSRGMVLHIADYLECAFDERNDLLLAAKYVPEKNDLKGKKLKAAIEQARQIMNFLPFPALLFTRDWKIHDYNLGFLKLYGLPDERQIPKKGLSLFHLVFDKKMPFRERNMVNLAEWENQAISTITSFKNKNLLFRHEGWYHRRLKQCYLLPDFKEFWNGNNAEPQHRDEPFTGTIAAGSNRVPIHYTHVLLTLVETGCPTILVFFPTDEAARQAFVEIGCSTSENIWIDTFDYTRFSLKL